jgi:hypothetical protein
VETDERTVKVVVVVVMVVMVREREPRRRMTNERRTLDGSSRRGRHSSGRAMGGFRRWGLQVRTATQEREPLLMATGTTTTTTTKWYCGHEVKIEIPASVQEGGWSEPWRLETGEREREVRRRRRRRRRQQDRNKTGNGQSVDEVPGVGCCPFG